MERKKIFGISIYIAIIGAILLLIPGIIMMCDFNREPAGEHVILSIMLGAGFGLLTSSVVYLGASQSKKNKTKKSTVDKIAKGGK